MIFIKIQMNKKRKTQQFSNGVQCESSKRKRKKINNGKELEQAHSMLFNITAVQCGSRIGQVTGEIKRMKRRCGC